MENKIEELHGLVKDLRERFEKTEEGIFTKADFEEFKSKSVSEILNRLAEVEKKVDRPGFGKEEKSKPSEEKVIFEKWLRKGVLSPEEQKVLKISDSETGGYLAPAEYVNEIIKTVQEFSPIRQIARVRRTSRSLVMIPKRTGVFSAQRTTEAGERTETTGLKYGLEQLDLPEAYALVKVTKQDLEDSAFNLEAEINQEFATQFAVLEGKEFISGDGVGEAEGLLANGDISSFNSGNASAITADAIVQIPYKVKSAYLRNARWVMNRNTIAAVMLLKDGNNRYLWQPSFQGGQPSRLAGYPIVEAPDMPDIAANAYPIMFGDFRSSYLVVDRVQIEIQRLVEKYAEYGQIGLIARKRFNGQVVLAEAVVKIKIAA